MFGDSDRIFAALRAREESSEVADIKPTGLQGVGGQAQYQNFTSGILNKPPNGCRSPKVTHGAVTSERATQALQHP
jgi:hypothetical protein